MSLSVKAKKEINTLIEAVVKKYISKAASKPKANSGNPFVMALLKDFEPLIHRIHGLKTSLGSEMEKIAEIIAIDAWGKANIQRKVKVNVALPKNVFQTIDSIINNLSNAKTLSDYEKEKRMILDACKKPSKTTEQHTYEFDLVVTDPKKKHTYILEMKGPDPNTTEVPGAKKDYLLQLRGLTSKQSQKKLTHILQSIITTSIQKFTKIPKCIITLIRQVGLLFKKIFGIFLERILKHSTL